MKRFAAPWSLLLVLVTCAFAPAQGVWELPQPSPNASGRESLAPALNATREVLYFADRATTGGGASIHFARKPLGLAGQWGPRTALVALSAGTDRRDPAVLPDDSGLIVAIKGAAAGTNFHLYLSQGDAAEPGAATWSAPVALANVNGASAIADFGAAVLRTPSNPLVGDLFFASDRNGYPEIHWAPHDGQPGFSVSSWGTPLGLGLVPRIPGATAAHQPSLALLPGGGVEMVFAALVGGVEEIWRTTNPSSVSFALGNPLAWTTPTKVDLAVSAGPVRGPFLDGEAGLLYFERTTAGGARLFVTGTTADDRPLLLANDTVAAGQNSRFVLLGAPNAYFALVSDLFAVAIPAPPYGVLGVLYPPSPSAFVFDGTGVFPGQNYLPLPLGTDAAGLFVGNLGPIPISLVGTTFHSQAFLYDPALGDWRLSDDGDPTNASPASITTITGGGALVQLRGVTLCDANRTDDALGSQPFVEPSTTFHDLDDPWISFTARNLGASALQARVSYEFLAANGTVLVPPAPGPVVTLPADARDHDYRFAPPPAPYQAACLPGASYQVRAALEIEVAPGTFVPEGLAVTGVFRVTTKRPVILVHGLGGDETSFGELAAIIEDEPSLRFPVRRFLYTAASTGSAPAGFAMDAKAQQLDLFMQDAGYADHTIVAHSLGGLVARRYLAAAGGASPAGDVRLVLLGCPNMGARTAFLFEPVYTAAATTATIQAFLPPIAPAIRDEITPGSAFLAALAQDWGAVATAIPVLNVVGNAGIDFDLLLGIIGLPVPAGILGEAATNDGLIHVDEATLPQAAALPGGLPNPIEAFADEAHNAALAEIHAFFGGPKPALAQFQRGDLAAGRPSLALLLAFHQAATNPLAIANPLATPPAAATSGTLVVPTTFTGAALDDWCASSGVVYRNQDSDALVWIGLPPIAAGTTESFGAFGPGLPCPSEVLAPAGLVRVPATRVAAPIAYPPPAGSLVLAPSASWPY